MNYPEGFVSLVTELHKKNGREGECPMCTLRRALVEGEVTEAQLVKIRDFGNKSLRTLLILLDLKRQVVLSWVKAS